jgi:UV DNA damage endonuclease
VARATAELALADQLLDAMGLGSEAVIVVHAGGGYGDLEAGRARFARVYDRLPPGVRRRLALENDDRLYSMADLHWIHQRTGVRLVLDVLHHRCNGGGEPLHEALLQALATWPAQERPKIHFSSPRTELRHITRQGQAHLLLPQPNQHSDFVHPFEFIDFLRSARGATSRAFDIMVEAKAKDLAVLRLREQLAAYAPDLASVVR